MRRCMYVYSAFRCQGSKFGLSLLLPATLVVSSLHVRYYDRYCCCCCVFAATITNKSNVAKQDRPTIHSGRSLSSWPINDGFVHGTVKTGKLRQIEGLHVKYVCFVCCQVQHVYVCNKCVCIDTMYIYIMLTTAVSTTTNCLGQLLVQRTGGPMSSHFVRRCNMGKTGHMHTSIPTC